MSNAPKPPEPDVEVILQAEKMSRRHWIACGLLILLVIPFFVFDENPDATILWMKEDAYRTITYLLGFCIGLFILSNLRCPACSRYLGNSSHSKFCRNCGTQLHR